MSSNPFAGTSSKAGTGRIRISRLPPDTAVLEQLSYQYPLKLIAPDALHNDNDSRLVHTVFLLTYGGGLVGGDQIDLHVSIADRTKLVLLTQGSTKIFKSEDDLTLTKQCMTVQLLPCSALCYLPDPVQPFALSAFEQRQIYHVESMDSSLCVLDWVCEGRLARGESWDFRRYKSMNEIWHVRNNVHKLLLRDNLILDARQLAHGHIRERMHKLGAFGTLIIGGPKLRALADFFLAEFQSLPRIGAKQWDDESSTMTRSSREIARASRLEQEKKDGVLWTAASTRGFTVVKFGVKEAEGGKRWLLSMLQHEGTIPLQFGEGSLLCMR